MENWKEVFVGIIPQGNYQTQITNGEDKGLILELKSNNNHAILNFGVVQAVRILDEGIVQKELYSDNEVEKYKKDGFRNVIYEVTDGEFAEQIQNIADGYWETLNAKHYIVITQNYNIDIITEWEPEINIL
jgi:hypothetical protein